MDKLTKEEIREAANNFFCSPEGRPLTIDEAAELICTVDAFEAGVEWAEEKYAQQFERPDNDSGQGWISVEEKLPEISVPITYAQNQEMYLVFSRGEISIAFYDGDNIFDSPCDGHLNEVSHWQPLPTEPK